MVPSDFARSRSSFGPFRVPGFSRSQGQSLSVESVQVSLTFLAGAIYVLPGGGVRFFCYAFVTVRSIVTFLVFKIFKMRFKFVSPPR